MVTSKPYGQLHFLVFLLAFTAILGELITIEAIPLVAWRTFMAALTLLIIIRRKTVGFIFKKKALLTGIVLGAHWITFFGAVKLSNITICLTGMATTSLFTAATEAIAEKRKPYPNEILLGILIIPGIIFIAGIESGHIWGLLCAILSALLAAIFPVLNKTMVRAGSAPSVITYYEMIGACATCVLAGFCFGIPMSGYIPQPLDWFWISLLSLVCTVFAFSFSIELLKKFSAYETALAINFEPVYGIILAAIIFHEHEEMHPLFFVGALVIFIVNFLHPILQRREKNTAPT